MNGFIDSHVHFHFPDYDADREAVMARARQAGIGGFINVGTDVVSSQAAIQIAGQFQDIWATAGVHPHDAGKADDEALSKIEELARHPKVVAIGEVGLDFFRDLSPREVQTRVLKRFIAMQKKISKPLILHCRDAYPELMAVFRETGQPPYDGVIHCFSSDASVMRELVDLGFYISFAGPLTYKKNDALREACKSCPIDRLILETDAPFLPPQTKRGKRNEPVFMIETAEVAASVRGLSVNELKDATCRNTRALFRL